MVQKNRHLLTAGCADIMLLMLRHQARDMCEAVAQTCTNSALCSGESSKVPTGGAGAAATKSANKQFSSSSYNPGSGQAAATAVASTVPLLEWAGLKVMLKFLFRYQQMTNQPRSNSIMRDSVSAALRLKEELLYAHTKVFTVVSTLISGSPSVAAHANSLPGVEQLLHLAADVHLNSVVGSADAEEMLVNSCLDALQSDRDRQQQLKTLEEEAPVSSALDTIGRLRASRSSHSPSRKLSVMPRSAPTKSIGSAPRKQVHSESINLTSAHAVDFKGQYNVETEKGKLYLLNSYDGSYDNAASEAAARQLRGIESNDHKTTGLAYRPHGDKLLSSSLETIDLTVQKVVSSLNDSQAAALNEPYANISSHLLPPVQNSRYTGTSSSGLADGGTPLQQELDRAAQGLSFDNAHGGSSFLFNSSKSGRVQTTGGGDHQIVDKGAQLLAHKFSVKTDLFDHLPSKPVIPLRIEPKDVITADEEMNVIRDKFKQLADSAVRKISQEVGYTKNGKNSIPIEERARRIYSPAKGAMSMSLSSLSGGGRAISRAKTSDSANLTRSSSGNLNQTGIFAKFRDSAGDETFLRADPQEESEYGEEEDGNLKTLAWNKPNYESGSPPMSPSSIYGLRLETLDFDEADMFENFKPIFDLPVREPVIVPLSTTPAVATDKSKPLPRLKVEMMQSMDIIV